VKLRVAITGAAGTLRKCSSAGLAQTRICEFILGLDIRPRALELPIPALFLRYDITMPWGEFAGLLPLPRH